MLQRADSNAYSWGWATHIRTKQSKWLEHNLQDMDERVTMVLKLIEEDGDSFAKRAEMYFKNRPEVIRFVEESYRAYRTLAERYDHISTDLQNANTTIAAVFPDRVQFAMDDDDEHGYPSFRNESLGNAEGDVPMVPKNPVKDLKGLITSAMKKMKHEKSTKDATTTLVAKSGMTKVEGTEEIARLCKRIGLEKTSSREGEEHDGNKRSKDMESLVEKMNEKFEVGFGETLSVAEMEDKIDELVDKAIKLETGVSSQLVLIERLRVEMDELHAEIQALEVDKCTLIDGRSRNHLMNKLKGMEEKLHRIQDLNRSVEDRNNDLQTHFTEAHYEVEPSKENNIDDSYKMLKRLNASKEFKAADASEMENSPAEVKSEEESGEQEKRIQYARDGFGILRSAKPETVVVSGWLQKEESVKPHEVEPSQENEINDSDKMPKEANAGKEFEAYLIGVSFIS